MTHDGGRKPWGWIIGGAGVSLATLPFFVADRLVRTSPPVLNEPERRTTYWSDSVDPLPRFRPVDEDILVDVAVIGGGFTGLAIAWYLKQLDPSIRVAVLEAQRVGSGSSSRNSGGAPHYFRAWGAMPQAERGFNLLRQFCTDRDLDVELEERVPMLTLHRSAETVDHPTFTGTALRQEINSSYYHAAVAGVSNRLHPGKLLAGLVAACRDAGVELYEDSPVSRINRGEPVWLETPRAQVSAKHVALATNAYTPGLGIGSDRMMALHHRVLVTRPLTDEEWDASGLEKWPYRLEHGGLYTHTVRRTPDQRFYFRHVLGHRAFERTDWEFTASDVAAGQQELLRRYPWLEGVPIEYEWHGVTARTRDVWPVAGRIEDNISIAAGYNGSGVVSSHYFGHLLAHQILGKPHQDLDMLKPPKTHPAIPGEFIRNVSMKAWLKYERRRDV